MRSLQCEIPRDALAHGNGCGSLLQARFECTVGSLTWDSCRIGVSWPKMGFSSAGHGWRKWSALSFLNFKILAENIPVREMLPHSEGPYHPQTQICTSSHAQMFYSPHLFLQLNSCTVNSVREDSCQVSLQPQRAPGLICVRILTRHKNIIQAEPLGALLALLPAHNLSFLLPASSVTESISHRHWLLHNVKTHPWISCCRIKKLLEAPVCDRSCDPALLPSAVCNSSGFCCKRWRLWTWAETKAKQPSVDDWRGNNFPEHEAVA